jgi:prolyl-tRNA synthetase
MRYRDLGIQTRRELPAKARTDGEALLVRAGYISGDGETTALGNRALDRMASLAEATDDLFGACDIACIRMEDGRIVVAMAHGALDGLHCPACGYAAEHDLARFRKATFPTEAPLPLQMVSTPDCDTIDSLASFLGVPAAKTAKALMFMRTADNSFVFALIRGDMQLSPAKLRRLGGEIELASSEQIRQAGAIPGYASPIGLKEGQIVVDDVIPQTANLVVGANEAGFHFINANCGRDFLADAVVDLALAQEGDPCPACASTLHPMRALVLADEGGHHFSSLLWAAAETHRDPKGLVLPPVIAPFQVHLVQLPSKEIDTRAAADQLYGDLMDAEISVLYDDRDERAGVKFNDADLIGCPIRITLGEKNLRAGMVECKARDQDLVQILPIGAVPTLIRKVLDAPHA